MQPAQKAGIWIASWSDGSAGKDGKHEMGFKVVSR
jgi:hypothetical protein